MRSIDEYYIEQPDSYVRRNFSLKHHHKTKLAAKIDKEERKEKGKKKKSSGGAGFDQAGAQFHEGILPSKYNLQVSELERVGRVKRRKEW